jgi:hypothetical protein
MILLGLYPALNYCTDIHKHMHEMDYMQICFHR